MTIASTWIEYSWLLVTFLALLIAAYHDWKNRIIPDKIWLVQLLISVILIIIWLVQGQDLVNIILVFSNITLGFLMMFVLLFTGAMAGGDIKGFFVISFSYPILLTIFEPLLQIPEIFPSLFSVLLNFLLFYIILALGFFSYNLYQIKSNPMIMERTNASLSQQIRLLFDSIWVPTSNIEERKFYNPAEYYEDGQWKVVSPQLDLLMEDEEWDEFEEKERRDMLSAINETGKEYIWIRPQIPGIPILFLSYVTSITLGTILGPIFQLLAT